jgi:tRNA modification GTPase
MTIGHATGCYAWVYFCRVKDTICALSTAPGVGGIAVIRISGNEAFALCEDIFSKKITHCTTHTLVHGWVMEAGQPVDEVLVAKMNGPRTFTGEDTVEISCHGSPFVQQKIIQLLLNAGCALAGPGEFTMRAYLNGKMDLSQAEAVADIIAAENDAMLRQSLHQMRGGFSKEINDLRDQLIHFASLVELELDFAEEDVEFADRSHLSRLVNHIQTVVQRLRDSFSLGNAMRNGVPVAILGAPNMGKSTLLNALLNEERAIVSDVAGTTRDTVEDYITLHGVRFKFIDTAGIRQTEDRVEKMGIERSFDKARQASVILLLFDAVETPVEELRAMVQQVKQVAGEGKRLILVANKVDKPGFQLERIQQGMAGLGKVMFLSAKTGEHLDELKHALAETVNLGEVKSGETIVTNVRHYDALNRAVEALKDVAEGLEQGVTGDFLAIDIRKTLYHLGEITGAISADDLLHSIFSRFCIGK